jgi:large subunit ribosomal protein L29
MATKADELRELPADELYARIESAKEELFNLRFQLATGQLDNPTMLKQVRHEIARIATVLREREIEEELDAIAAISENAGQKKDEPKKVEVEQ